MTQSAGYLLPNGFNIYPIFSLSQLAPSSDVAQKFPLLPTLDESGHHLLCQILQLLLLIPSTLMQDLESVPPSLCYLVLSLCAVHSLLTPSSPSLILVSTPPPPSLSPPHLSNLFHCLAYLGSLVRSSTFTGTEQQKEEHMRLAMISIVSQVYSMPSSHLTSLPEGVFSPTGTDPPVLQVGEDVSIPLPAAGVPPRLYPDHILGVLSTKDQPRWVNGIHITRYTCNYIQ